MTASNRGVPRADHVPAKEQEESIRMQESEPADATGGDSAVRRGHGAHGTGDDREERLDASKPEPDFTSGSDRGGSDAWGSERSGGSSFDKRSPDKGGKS
ncbi:MAG: hypothetical protein JWM95_1583 [Gemmatimonadetes bacterium]|nr:hypothetical protein [Gemmatimonadota bacterium]